MIGVTIALALLFGLLALVSYVDRLYQEIGKFLPRFQTTSTPSSRSSSHASA